MSNSRYKLVGIKSQTAYGVDSIAPGAPAAFLDVIDAKITPIRTTIQRSATRGTHSAVGMQSVPSHCDVTMSGYLSGKTGAVGTAPAYADLLKACNLAETLTASTSASYSPTTLNDFASTPPVTVYVYERQTGGQYRVFKALDVKGSITFTFAENDFIKWEFTGIGSYVAPATALAAGPSLPTVYGAGKSPLPTQNMSFTVSGSPFALMDLELDLAWSLEESRSLTGTSNLDYIELIRPDATPISGSLNFKRTEDFATVLTARAANSVVPMVATVTNGSDTITLTMPSVSFDQWSDDNGNISTFAVPFFVYGSGAGNNDFTLVFT